jgi:hypothetical protein
MPIKDCPFTLCRGGIYRPMLPIRIINPHVVGGVYRTIGLIDTGADECAIPATYASILGHNLLSGLSKQIGTGNGITYTDADQGLSFYIIFSLIPRLLKSTTRQQKILVTDSTKHPWISCRTLQSFFWA